MKEFYSEYPYTNQLDATINILLHFINHLCNIVIYKIHIWSFRWPECISHMMYLILVHSSWFTDPKTMDFPKCWEWQRCLLLKVTFESTKDGCRLPGEPAMWFEGWNFQSPPLPFPTTWRRGDGLEVNLSQWPGFNQPCLSNEAAIKTQKDWGQTAPRLISTWRFGQRVMSGEGKEAPHTLLSLVLCTSSSVCPWAISFYNKPVT